jgi:hypothetical protein
MKVSGIFCQIKWTVCLFVLATLLTACDLSISSHSVDRIKPDSPFHSILKPSPYTRDSERMAGSILEKLPVGSSKLAIDSFIAQHFLAITPKVIYPNIWDKQNAFIEIRALEFSSIAGGGHVKIYFFLDDQQRLTKVEVDSNAAYL